MAKSLLDGQKGLTSGRDVAHLLGNSGLLDGGDGVTSTNDGDASLGGQASQGVGNALERERKWMGSSSMQIQGNTLVEKAIDKRGPTDFPRWACKRQ